MDPLSVTATRNLSRLCAGSKGSPRTRASSRGRGFSSSRKSHSPRTVRIVDAACPNQELVSEGVTQSLERTAHCRLAQKTTLCCTDYMTFFQEGVEGGQKIQVDLSQMHIMHTIYSNNALVE